MVHAPRLAVVAALSLTAALAGVLIAGPLDPPAGPIASTGKTLTEVEPRTAINATNTPGDADSLYKVTQPGSYYLTGNITGVANKHGIEIAASGVTLDLNGFDLAGIPAMGAFDGVNVSMAGLINIAVVNGSVRAWGGEGVDLATALVTNGRLADLVAFGNAGHGIMAGTGCLVTNCSAWDNTGDGIITGPSCTVSNCSASSNTVAGIRTDRGCTITNCSAWANTGDGINALVACQVSNCSASQNFGDGIEASTGSAVTNCSATNNFGRGISVGAGCTVAECTASNNALDGIRCTSGCTIRHNTCATNGLGSGDGAGIHSTLGDNRIEGNNCSSAERGIDVDAAGSIIIGNTCSGNTTNWVIAAGNYYGPIIDRTGIVTAAVNGAAAAGTLATTDPHANFSY